MTSDAPEVRAVLFDADGVIQRMSPDWRISLERLCEDPAQIDSFIEDVFRAEHGCLTGARDFEVVLPDVLARWNSRADLTEALAIWTMIEPEAAVLELVRRLRAGGTIVALATNQQRHRAEHMIHALDYGTEFDHIFCSCHVGHAKPSAEYFEATIEILGLPPHHILFIDDHERNVSAAKSLGLHSFQFHIDEGPAELASRLDDYQMLPT